MRTLFGLLILLCRGTIADDTAEASEYEHSSGNSARTSFRTPSRLEGSYNFADGFVDTAGLGNNWIVSKARKEGAEEEIAKYDGQWIIDEPSTPVLTDDFALILNTKARHHAVSAKFDRPFRFDPTRPLIVQYDVKFENGQDCGGAYIKLLTEEGSKNLQQFQDKTPYSIMFGPDKCGMDSKLHFIVRFKNPKTGEIEEKHGKRPDSFKDDYFNDKKSHLYTLDLDPDGTYEMKVDQKTLLKGSLSSDFTPVFVPSKEIDDPKDKKPEDWDEREKIPDPSSEKPEDWDESLPEYIDDPEATKPDDWLEDEPALVPDPDAVQPEDWDEEMDGKWEAKKIANPKCSEASGCGEWKHPQIKNIAYKGKWSAPLIKNPDYKGKWKARLIDNPAYFEDENLFAMLTPFNAIGLELWSMSDRILFDNFLITDDRNVATAWTSATWSPKHTAEASFSSVTGFFSPIIDAANERPYLWVVYILLVLIPIVLITVYCCGTSTPDAAALAKKTDELQPDDDDEGMAEMEMEEPPELVRKASQSSGGSTGAQDAASNSRPLTKADLEGEESDEDEEEVEEEEEVEDVPEPSPSKPAAGARRRPRRD